MPVTDEVSAVELPDQNNCNSEPPTPVVNITPQHLFRKEMGVSQPTVWRWTNKGWLTPVNISGRTYFTRESVEAFMKRARAGEFAKSLPIPNRKEVV